MSQPPPPLLPIFRSAAQLAVLAELLTGAARELSIGELAERTGVPQATVSREVARLVGAGILTDREVGRTRLVSAHVGSPIHGELAALVLKVAGAPAVLRELLAGVPGVREAYIYGSWARRHLGEPGDEPADIDVLVIADPDDRVTTVRRARDAADTATERLGRDVSVSVLTPAEWADGGSGFVRTVRESPLVPLALNGPR
ncbi:MAG: MarR family transcriptional regulator [Pseudonocardia sp.]|nr:MarR family transcriptional regulator [Pseudonocardia sp.]